MPPRPPDRSSAATASRPALDRARERGLNAAGFFETGARWLAIANKKGNFGFHRATVAEYSTTMRTADGTGSGYAWFASPRLADIDAAALAERAAARRPRRRRNPRDLAPGAYTVILEPEAVADLLVFLAFSLNARTADEGRSFLSKPGGGNRLGEKLFADGVTLRSDPFDRAQPGHALGRAAGPSAAAVAIGGLPARKTTWIENGVVKTLAVDRYWAKKTKVEPVPLSGGLILEGSDKSLDALIAETPRALLVTRFWYIRSVNPQNAMVTGLTRDGVWLIENGKVVHPVNNFRFNDSPVNLLKNLEATSVAVAGRQRVLRAHRPGDPRPRLPLHLEERRGLRRRGVPNGKFGFERLGGDERHRTEPVAAGHRRARRPGVRRCPRCPLPDGGHLGHLRSEVTLFEGAHPLKEAGDPRYNATRNGTAPERFTNGPPAFGGSASILARRAGEGPGPSPSLARRAGQARLHPER